MVYCEQAESIRETWNGISSDKEGRDFFEATQDVFLQQHVDFPTHDGNTLDLVLSTNDIQVQSVEDVGNLGKSHHSIPLDKVISNPTRPRSTEQVPDFAKADFSKLKDCMSIGECGVGRCSKTNKEI